MTEYVFTRDVHSLATGKDYRKGQHVPQSYPTKAALIASGAIVKAHRDDNTDNRDKYMALTVTELAELLRNRDLTIRGTKAEKVARLLEDDNA